MVLTADSAISSGVCRCRTVVQSIHKVHSRRPRLSPKASMSVSDHLSSSLVMYRRVLQGYMASIDTTLEYALILYWYMTRLQM